MLVVSEPLLLTHPELSVIEGPGYTEFRVENWRLARNGSGKIVRGSLGLSVWPVAIGAAVLAALWPKIQQSTSLLSGLAVGLVWLLWSYFTRILHESVIVIHPHGIQLETCRATSTSRRFIPTESLRDFIINEGLYGWNVRYYIAVVQNPLALQVAYENILPHFPLLHEVYTGVHKILFPQISS